MKFIQVTKSDVSAVVKRVKKKRSEDAADSSNAMIDSIDDDAIIPEPDPTSEDYYDNARCDKK